jgi:hypothetical protein
MGMACIFTELKGMNRAVRRSEKQVRAIPYLFGKVKGLPHNDKPFPLDSYYPCQRYDTSPVANFYPLPVSAPGCPGDAWN